MKIDDVYNVTIKNAIIIISNLLVKHIKTCAEGNVPHLIFLHHRKQQLRILILRRNLVDKSCRHHLQLKMNQFQVLIMVLIFVCQTLATWAKFHPRDVLARSCLDYFEKGDRSSGYYQIKSDGANNSFQTVFCDMESEPGSAWTLVESFALKNKAIPAFSRRPLKINAPVLPKTPNWNHYRMSYSQMNDLKKQSTHWRVTCDFQAKPVDLYRDYAVASFTNFDAMTFEGGYVCKKMKYINVRGHQCAECTASWHAHANTDSMHLDSPTTGCQFTPGGEAVHNEDNFGLYLYINTKFRCTSSPNATTNYWFGGYF